MPVSPAGRLELFVSSFGAGFYLCVRILLVFGLGFGLFIGGFGVFGIGIGVGIVWCLVPVFLVIAGLIFSSIGMIVAIFSNPALCG